MAQPEGHSLARSRRGKLKIFFGYAAAVGTSRAMLQAAQERIAAGTWVEGEDRFDLDAALRRRPELVLLPDLSRRNPAGSRHRRRHQDVEELLEAGINVWSTLEIGKLEDTADLVERIVGRPMEETIPDAIFDSADEVELIDLAPEELLDRRGTDGGVAERATLVALREITLRRAADRLNSREPGRQTVERLLVCVGPSPTSARVIRTASRMARSAHGQWIAVHAGRTTNIGREDELRLSRHLQLAESLGAQTTILPGGDVAAEIVSFARSHGVTRIVIGKTGRRDWRSWLRRSLVDQVITASGDIDVHVIRGVEQPEAGAGRSAGPPGPRLGGYAAATGVLASSTAVAATFAGLGLTEANLVLAYLLGVAVVAGWLGRGPAIFASFGAVLLFNFFFTSPRYTLRVHDSGYLFTFTVMLVIGLLVSTLTARIRDQSTEARQRERRTEQLYLLSQDLSATTGHLQIAAAAETRLSGLLDADVSILLPDERGQLSRDVRLVEIAGWVYAHGRMAGAGTETHADADSLCLPLSSPAGVAGVLAVRSRDPDLLLLPDRRRLIETFAAQVALALQRDQLTEQVHRTLAQAENERLRSAVLSSISHDFRTPLSAIAGASSSLLDAGDHIDPLEQRELLGSIYEEADWLARLVDNLLQMTRLEAGQIEPRREWQIVEDLVGSALTRLARRLAQHPVTTRVPARGMPLLRVDGVLIELVLTNLLDNAAKYAPAGSSIEVAALVAGDRLLIEVADRGPGLSAEERARAFEKFYRGPRSDGSRGAGLGLTIASAVARLHGGSLAVEDRDGGGGARFVLALPVEEQPPAIEDEP